jgi:hypothetical protein
MGFGFPVEQWLLKPYCLMITSGIILPNILIYLGDSNNPIGKIAINQPGLNGMIEGF